MTAWANMALLSIVAALGGTAFRGIDGM